MATTKALSFTGSEGNYGYDKTPDHCPFCHKVITPRKYQAYIFRDKLEIVYRCPDSNCGKIFIGYYKKEQDGTGWTHKLKNTSIGTFVETEFSDHIKELSKDFTEIFNQASKAESFNLHHIAGIGYRKALEFLIKDYLIDRNPEKEEDIKKKFLGKCIKDDIENVNVKDMAERATWLGNDETHYVRKWEGKDINDLKILIKITLHWIEMELLTFQFKQEMN